VIRTECGELGRLVRLEAFRRALEQELLCTERSGFILPRH
jgi:hypothetical protein